MLMFHTTCLEEISCLISMCNLEDNVETLLNFFPPVITAHTLSRVSTDWKPNPQHKHGCATKIENIIPC